MYSWRLAGCNTPSSCPTTVNCAVMLTHLPRSIPSWLRDLKAQTLGLITRAKWIGEWGCYKESLTYYNKTVTCNLYQNTRSCHMCSLQIFTSRCTYSSEINLSKMSTTASRPSVLPINPIFTTLIWSNLTLWNWTYHNLIQPNLIWLNPTLKGSPPQLHATCHKAHPPPLLLPHTHYTLPPKEFIRAAEVHAPQTKLPHPSAHPTWEFPPCSLSSMPWSLLGPTKITSSGSLP